MRPNLLAAGVENPDAFLDGLEARTEQEVEEYTGWLTVLTAEGGEYRAFMGVWGLKSHEWWANMALLGETDLREHRLLRPLAKALRAAWRKKNPKARIVQSTTA